MYIMTVRTKCIKAVRDNLKLKEKNKRVKMKSLKYNTREYQFRKKILKFYISDYN